MSIVTIDEVEKLGNHPEKYLIDVREPKEVEDHGRILNSINIPLGTIEETLKLSAVEFKEKFGREKPTETTEVIFHCRMGGRAGRALEAAKGLGFQNVKNFKGGWVEWADKYGLPK